MKKKFLALFVALGLLLAPLTACGSTPAPACPAGQVAENDDDGWECEPDEDGDGVDDEEQQEGGILGGIKRKKKTTTTAKRASSSRSKTSSSSKRK